MGESSEASGSVVRFEPSGRTFSVMRGGSLWRAALRARMPIASSCRGQGVCKACKIRVLSGQQNLSTLTESEASLGLEPGQRLACLARVVGPVTITADYW